MLTEVVYMNSQSQSGGLHFILKGSFTVLHDRSPWKPGPQTEETKERRPHSPDLSKMNFGTTECKARFTSKVTEPIGYIKTI